MNQTTLDQYQRFVQSFDHLEWLAEDQDVAAFIQLSIQAHDFKQQFERICTQHDYSGRAVLSFANPFCTTFPNGSRLKTGSLTVTRPF